MYRFVIIFSSLLTRIFLLWSNEGGIKVNVDFKNYYLVKYKFFKRYIEAKLRNIEIKTKNSENRDANDGLNSSFKKKMPLKKKKNIYFCSI